MKMKKILSIYNYRICIIIFWALQHIRLLQIHRYKFITYGLVIWAFFLIVFYNADLLKNMKKHYILLFIFWGAYVLSTLLNYQYSFIDNLQLCIWEFIQFFLLTYFPGNNNVRTKKMYALLKIFALYTIIFSILSLIMFWLNINGIARDIFTNEEFRYGYRNGRLFGMYGSPNYGSLFAAISVLISIHFYANNYHKKICIVNSIVQFYYIALSESRTGMLCLSIVSILGISYIKLKRIHVPRKNIGNTLIKSFFITLCIISFLAPVKSLSVNVLNTQIKQQQPVERNQNILVNNITVAAQPKKSTSYSSTSALTQRDDLQRSRDISNERFAIWYNAINDFFPCRPLFGLTQLGYMHYGKEFLPDSYIIRYNKYSLHNDYVTALIGCGLIGFTMFILFLLQIVIKFSNYFSYIKKHKFISIEWLAFTIIIVCLITMFFSDAILLNITTESLLFWSCLGYLLTQINSKRNTL